MGDVPDDVATGSAPCTDKDAARITADKSDNPVFIKIADLEGV